MCLLFSGLIVKTQPFSEENAMFDEILSSSKAVAMFDSLANSKFFHSHLFLPDMSIKDKYNMPEDYVPELDVSVIKERIADMNAKSPIEFIFNEDVLAHIDFYLKRRSLLARLLGLTELYFPLFEEMLDKYDLPLELKFVSIIESALNPLARSRAGACGLWQFMLRTGQFYGLKTSSYIDDRFDPYKSTDAACRHFLDLYKIYGDWALCLAAYNAGAGRVNRAIIKSGNGSDYWEVRRNLPRETQGYVPAFIAAAYVFTYYIEHNIRPLVPVIIDTQIDTVSIKGELSFDAISDFLDIDIELIKFLNPSYKKNIIPSPFAEEHKLRIPKTKFLEFAEKEVDMYYYTYATKYPELLSDYITSSGFTVYKGNYTTEHNISLSIAIYENDSSAQENEIHITDSLKVLKLISTQEELLALVRNNNISDSKNVGTSSSRQTYDYHTVRRGENLHFLARKYGCSVEQIKQWNNFRSNTIHPGQKLKVSGSGSVQQSSQQPSDTGSNAIWYTVKAGDNLWDIAQRYSTSVNKIKDDNNLSGNKLNIGQRLKIITN